MPFRFAPVRFPSRPRAFAPRATAAAILMLLAHPPAFAQSPASSTTLREVTVTGEGAATAATTEGTGSYTTRAPLSTATGLGLTPRQTPQSISVITRERLEEQGLQTLAEAMQQVTGVYVNYSDTERITYNARGYAINNFQVDGMLSTFGGYLKANGDTVVYDRIEVVRGAAGLLTGAGDPSATINQVRKRPTRNFQGSAALRIGSHDLRRAEIDLSGPLAFDGKLRGRFVAAKQEADSFRPMYHQDLGALYGIVEADLGPGTTVAVGYERQKSDPRGSTWGTVPYWNADGSLANLPHDLNLSTPWASWNMQERKLFATLEHRIATDWRVRLGFTDSRREQDGSLYFGYGGYPRPDGSGITVASGRFPYEEEMEVFDVNVDGRFQAFGRQHDLLFGWSSAKRQTETLGVVTGAVPPGYGVIPNWRTWTGNVPIFPTTVQPYPSDVTRIDQQGGYLATRLHVADPLRLILGARYSDYRTDSRRYNAATGAPTGTSGYANDGVVTPYAGVLLDLSPQWTAYGSYTSIFQPQNFRDRSNDMLEPVEGRSVEAGLKGELFDGQLNLSAAIFRSEKDNVAEIDDTVPPNSLPGGAQAYRSSGKGNVIDGFELEAAGRLTRQWNVFAGYSHTRSRNAAGDPINTVVPRNLLRLFTSYKLGEGLRWTLGGGLNYQGTIWSTAQRPTGAYNTSGAPVTALSRIEQDGVWLASLMAGYRIDDHLSLTLNVNNLFDKHYANRVGFYNGLHYADPRTVTLTLRGTF